MALIHVEEGRLQTQQPQKAHSADAQQNLLHNPGRAVAAIDAQGQIPEMLFVLGEIGIQQINRTAPDIDAPGLEINLAHRDLDRGEQRFAFVIEHGLNREVSRIEQRVIIDLPIIMVDRLLEITFAIKQAHPHETQAKIAGRLGMIARQDPEASRRDRQRFVKAEFSGEIRHRLFEQGRCIGLTPGGLFAHVSLKALEHLPNPFSKVRILKAHPQFVIRHLMQDRDRVVVKILPTPRRKFLKDFLRLLVPSPPKISRQSIQANNQTRQITFWIHNVCLTRHCFQKTLPS